ncbi:hypothetical protein DL95DRAFT_56099 [Leptodontidium sp. 2 PMI_412]|nr:hypothetical protein DL95DRAFT_56099 [Leptodontidium sp. 2 PMI_412]
MSIFPFYLTPLLSVIVMFVTAFCSLARRIRIARTKQASCRTKTIYFNHLVSSFDYLIISRVSWNRTLRPLFGSDENCVYHLLARGSPSHLSLSLSQSHRHLASEITSTPLIFKHTLLVTSLSYVR